MDDVLIRKVAEGQVAESHVCDTNDGGAWQVFDRNVRLYDADSGQLKAILVKKCIHDPHLIRAGRNLLRYKAYTTNRVSAGGVRPRKKKPKYNTGLYKGNHVASSIVGYIEPQLWYKCRQTAIYARNKEIFDSETLSLIQYISTQFAHYARGPYERQKRFVEKLPRDMVLPDTVYTTITVNCDWRTHVHRDKGDYNSGLGTLLVFDYTKSDLYKRKTPTPPGVQSWSGAELLLPEYRIGFSFNEGDLLLVDVHELHCNNPLKGKGRVSMVCYARENILTKCPEGLVA